MSKIKPSSKPVLGQKRHPSGAWPASFVLELPLQVTSKDAKTILVRMEAGRQLYNACLGESLKRLSLYRQSKAYQIARSIPKTEPVKRRSAFRSAQLAQGLSEYHLHTYATDSRASWLGDHLHTHLAQNIASRAYKAIEKMMFGTARKVRFKGKNQLPSLEGKQNTTGIRFEDGQVLWSGLSLKAVLNPKDEVQKYALSQRVKYCRMITRVNQSGNHRFFVQLVLEGHPLPVHCRKPKQNRVPAGSVVGTIGIDLGPSTIAVVGDEVASLEGFCPELANNQPKIRRLQRKMDRSKRRSNPNNYKEDGQIKSGRKVWTFSKTYLKDKAMLADLKRREKAHRKNLHGRKVNELLQFGNCIKLEKLSYKAWQKRFGKSVGKNAPGLFVSTLKRKAASAGVLVVEVNPVATYLSSRCVCGLRQKKHLSERTHRCGQCGIEMQRDLFSAFLVKHVDGKNKLHADVEQLYLGAKRLLGCAWNTAKTANRRSVNASVVSKARRQSGSSRKVRRTAKNMDVVMSVASPDGAFLVPMSSNASESHKEADASLSKPPAFRPGVV